MLLLVRFVKPRRWMNPGMTWNAQKGQVLSLLLTRCTCLRKLCRCHPAGCSHPCGSEQTFLSEATFAIAPPWYNYGVRMWECMASSIQPCHLTGEDTVAWKCAGGSGLVQPPAQAWVRDSPSPGWCHQWVWSEHRCILSALEGNIPMVIPLSLYLRKAVLFSELCA